MTKLNKICKDNVFFPSNTWPANIPVLDHGGQVIAVNIKILVTPPRRICCLPTG